MKTTMKGFLLILMSTLTILLSCSKDETPEIINPEKPKNLFIICFDSIITSEKDYRFYAQISNEDSLAIADWKLEVIKSNNTRVLLKSSEGREDNFMISGKDIESTIDKSTDWSFTDKGIVKAILTASKHTDSGTIQAEKELLLTLVPQISSFVIQKGNNESDIIIEYQTSNADEIRLYHTQTNSNDTTNYLLDNEKKSFLLNNITPNELHHLTLQIKNKYSSVVSSLKYYGDKRKELFISTENNSIIKPGNQYEYLSFYHDSTSTSVNWLLEGKKKDGTFHVLSSISNSGIFRLDGSELEKEILKEIDWQSNSQYGIDARIVVSCMEGNRKISKETQMIIGASPIILSCHTKERGEYVDFFYNVERAQRIYTYIELEYIGYYSKNFNINDSLATIKSYNDEIYGKAYYTLEVRNPYGQASYEIPEASK